MFDHELLVADITDIIWALEQISRRFQPINSSDDFLKDDAGLEKLDSICMQLINIGEVLKQVDKLTSCMRVTAFTPKTRSSLCPLCLCV